MKSRKTKVEVKCQRYTFNIPYDVLMEYAEKDVAYCTTCGKFKPVSEFTAISKTDRRPRNYCKKCNKTAWPSCKKENVE